MEWNQLQKFMVAAKEENFSRAAELLNMTQPSLSQAIKRLEEELGFQLFLRNGKKISLNESGRIFLQAVEQMDALMKDTKTRLEELNGMRHPNVSLHFVAASKLLPELLLYLKARNPGTQYYVHQWQTENEGNEDDIRILSSALESPDKLPKVPEVLLFEKILLALPKNHALLQKEKI